MKGATISKPENRRRRRPAKLAALAACALLLAACVGDDEYSYGEPELLEAPEYDFTANSWGGTLSGVPKGRTVLFADENAFIRSIDAKDVPIGQRYWDLTEKNQIRGLGPGPSVPNNNYYYTYEKFDYDGAILRPGMHKVSIGYLRAEYTEDNLKFFSSEDALDIAVRLDENATYMASSVAAGDRYRAIVVQAVCKPDRSMYVYLREECFGKGLVVASSDPLYVGLSYNETKLDHAEIVAIQKTRNAEAARVYSESMGEIMKDFPLFGSGSGQ